MAKNKALKLEQLKIIKEYSEKNYVSKSNVGEGLEIDENGKLNATGKGLIVDSELSETSENAVQNKVVMTALNNKADKSKIPTSLPANGGNADTVDGLHANEIANNPNILDNPDFTINQRSELLSFVTNTGYKQGTIFVDRWKVINDGSYFELTSKGLKCSIKTQVNNGGTTTNYICGLYQIIENPSIYSGQVCTFSINVSEMDHQSGFLQIFVDTDTESNVVVKQMNITSTGITSMTCTLPENLTKLNIAIRAIVTAKGATTNSTTTIKWVKLELGSIVTPFISPNPIEERRKCQRYFRRLYGKYYTIGQGVFVDTTHAYFIVPLNTSLRETASPTVSMSGTLHFWTKGHTTSTTLLSITSVYAQAYNKEQNCIVLYCTGTFTDIVGQAFIAQFRDDTSYIDISADI